MTNHPQKAQRSATKGLATIALLKVNYDAGHDYIGMFSPFVLDALPVFDKNGFSIQEVRDEVIERSDLALPVGALRVLLSRMIHRRTLRREGGRYFLIEALPQAPGLPAERRRVEERQQRLAAQLSEYAMQRDLNLPTTEDALAAILGFIERNHVPLALAEPPADLDTSRSQGAGVVARMNVVVAGFLHEQILAEGDSASIIQEMLEGFVLQNALFLRDIAEARRRFDRLETYLDTRLLMGALGFRGQAEELATREALSLLREAGATLAVFEPTIRELRRILAVYEHNLGTAEGRLSLRPGDLTRHFLTSHYSPSEVAQQSALAERNLQRLGINIRSLPRHDPDFTLDEAALSEKLTSARGGEDEPRVVHDVECIAAVLTLRAGKEWDSYERARAVFVTTSGLLVRNAFAWYEEQGGRGIPPIIHHLNLSNLAWLKRPASASKLKLHELVALCASALRPTRQVWESFLRHLRVLLASGELSSDEATAIVVSALTERVLAEEASDEDVDAETVSEVIDRVKASYAADADRRIAEAQVASELSEKQALELRTSIEGRSRQLSSAACSLLSLILFLLLVAGLVTTILSMIQGHSPSPVGIAFASLFAISGLLSVLWGFNLKGWRQSLEERFSRTLRVWLSGQPRTYEPAGDIGDRIVSGHG